MAKRAIIYTRISQDRTGEGLGVARQEEACRQLCAARGWEVVGVESDNSISAYTGKSRPGFDAVLERARGGECDVVVAWAIDRLTRSLKDLIRLVEDAQTGGVAVVTANGDIDLTTATGRMVATILAAVAQQEVEHKAARQRLANEQKAQSGGRTKGIRPFGYEDDGVTIREVEAEAIREGAQAIIAGASLSSVGRAWRDRGLLPSQRRDGKQTEWSISGVRGLYRNARYIGKRVYKGQVVADAEWAPILDESTFYAVGAILDNPARLKAPGYRDANFRTPKSLLATLAVCGKCGGPARASVQGKAHVPAYTCRSGGCFSMQRKNAEGVVVAEVLAWAEGVDSLSSEADEEHAEAFALRAELEQLTERRRQIGEAIGSGAMDFDVGLAAQEAVRGAVELASERLAELAAGSITADLATAPSPAEWWSELTIARQREVVDHLMEVRLHPQRRARFRDDFVEIIPK